MDEPDDQRLRRSVFICRFDNQLRQAKIQRPIWILMRIANVGFRLNFFSDARINLIPVIVLAGLVLLIAAMIAVRLRKQKLRVAAEETLPLLTVERALHSFSS
ncbi:hypothetical protein L596_002852 [Steinernema carpocapsae]|uniref:Uncharacterized protein n=1 Tax=Steinernema carpocapsae TaxID=34508 RepID=A0A4U8UQF6_STECR|nr:hypothetical protein L596_002852 [Steinernema carpocapsae]